MCADFAQQQVYAERWRIFRNVENRCVWLGVEEFKFVVACIGEREPPTKK